MPDEIEHEQLPFTIVVADVDGSSRTLSFVADSLDPGFRHPWPGEETGSDDLTLIHGFPAAPYRPPDPWRPATLLPAVLPVHDKEGKLTGLKMDRMAAARIFVREEKIKYLGKSARRHLYAAGRIVPMDEEEDQVIIEWSALDESRVRERCEYFLRGYEAAMQQIGKLLGGDPDRVAQLCNVLPTLPWGTTGDIEKENPHLDFVSRVLTPEPGSNVTVDELWEVFRTVNDLDQNLDWGRESMLRGELKTAVDLAFADERSVRASNGNIKRKTRMAGGFSTTRRHHGWIGLALSPRR